MVRDGRHRNREKIIAAHASAVADLTGAL